jgi:hypothetical protein
VAVYVAFRSGVTLEQAIAELAAAKAKADVRRQEETLTSQPSNQQHSAPPPATASRPTSVDWAGLIRCYQQHKLRSGEIKETTWERLYKPRMALVLKAGKGPLATRDATQVLEAQADLWSQRPGCRTRRLQIQCTAALLRWAVSQKLLPAQWAPPPDLSTIIGRSRESRAVTTPIAVPDILAMVQAIPDPRWRFAFQLLCAFCLPRRWPRRWATAFRPTWLPTAAGAGMTSWMTPSPRPSKGWARGSALRVQRRSAVRLARIWSTLVLPGLPGTHQLSWVGS